MFHHKAFKATGSGKVKSAKKKNCETKQKRGKEKSTEKKTINDTKNKTVTKVYKKHKEQREVRR